MTPNVYLSWKCVISILPPDQEEALAWQRQSGQGAERDSIVQVLPCQLCYQAPPAITGSAH